MSMMLMVKAMQTKVGSPLRKLVLLKLADNANDKGECWPSYQHIADQCEISRDSAMRHIKKLEEQGLLIVEKRKLSNSMNQSNIYHLNLGSGTELLPSSTDQLGSSTEQLGGSSTKRLRTSNSLEPINESKYSDHFESWWSIYPKKTAKGKAWDIWKKDKLDKKADQLINKLEAQNAMQYSQTEPQYIPMPSTYLSQSRYDDEVQLVTKAPQGGSNATSTNYKLSAVERVRLNNERARAERAAKSSSNGTDLGVYDPNVRKSLG